VKHWELIADRLSKAGFSWGCVAAFDSNGRTIWIADAHRDDADGETPAPPLRIEVVNANELAPRAKVATVKRDDTTGKISGLVVASVPDPS
jgi:hypothetical protein